MNELLDRMDYFELKELRENIASRTKAKGNLLTFEVESKLKELGWQVKVEFDGCNVIINFNDRDYIAYDVEPDERNFEFHSMTSFNWEQLKEVAKIIEEELSKI